VVNCTDTYSAVQLKKSFFQFSFLYISVLFTEYLSGLVSQVLIHVPCSWTHCHAVAAVTANITRVLLKRGTTIR